MKDVLPLPGEKKYLVTVDRELKPRRILQTDLVKLTDLPLASPNISVTFPKLPLCSTYYISIWVLRLL